MNMQRIQINRLRSFALAFLPLFLMSWKTGEGTARQSSTCTPANYEISMTFSFTAWGQAATVEAYLPLSDDRQQIRLVNHDPAGFDSQAVNDAHGRRMSWRSAQAAGAQHIRYTFQFSGSAAVYDVPAGLTVAGNQAGAPSAYLAATPAIPAGNSFIQRQAEELSAGRSDLAAVLRASFAYAGGLPNRPGPAFASLFYGRSDWKNYLFLSLCRAQGIPARVVNGLEVEPAGGYQLRQWAEVYAGGSWIPFDAAAQHFASLPDNYLALYRGETPALQHSSNLTVQTALEVTPAPGLLGALVR